MTVINEYEFDREHNQLSMQVDDINGLITHVISYLYDTIQCRESVPNWRIIYNSLVDEQQAVYDKLNLLLSSWEDITIPYPN